ncbi:MAG: hypothetical protein PHR35_15770, partial [Kiritimatiellae bacterium]|nr:hypothetical protein [Kiritimatiellia bacterium]
MNRVGQSIICVVVGVAAIAAARAETIVFQDRISSHRISSNYPTCHPVLVQPQSAGSSDVRTNAGVVVSAPGEEIVLFNSGSMGQWVTVAATNTVTDRYGQVFARVALGSGSSCFTRLALSPTNAPLFPNYNFTTVWPHHPTNVGADVYWDGWGNFNYYNGTSYKSVGAYPTNEWQDVTLNYDLVAQVYDVWLGSVRVATNAAFEFAAFGSTAQSIVIGSAWWGNGYEGLLDQWYWKSDNSTAFTSPGQPMMPGPNVVTTIFEDRIKGYTPNVRYTNVNPRVIHTQYSGNYTVVTNATVAVIPPGEQAISLNSHAAWNCSTIAATNAPVTDRFGQIYARVADQAKYGVFLRLGLFDTISPAYPTGFSWCDSRATNAAASLEWEASAKRFFYFKNKARADTGVAIPTTGTWHDVTLNYDLGMGIYDVWLNETRIVASSTLEWPSFSTQACAIAFGAIWYTTTPDILLDRWMWRSATTAPFTKWYAPPKGTALLVR